jgi:methylenetetrahydrofolate dehydrogenase (NADP+)/methenyltetrahydrofolate cyclohydrolase
MGEVVDGAAILRETQQGVGEAITRHVAATGITPRIVVVQVGDDAAAGLYTRRLSRNLQPAGVTVEVQKLPEEISLHAAQDVLRGLSADPLVHGVQLQTPLPTHIPMVDLVRALDPHKDLDGIHPHNAGLLAQGVPDIVPATPLGGFEILRRHGVVTEGATAVVVGRSPTVGRPMAQLLLLHNATVTVCHTRTRDLAAITARADILVAAAGRAGLITPDMVRPGAAVIDFGVNVVEGSVVGDVDPAVAETAALFTPVPGGTGPVTNAMLLRNTLALYERALGASS